MSTTVPNPLLPGQAGCGFFVTWKNLRGVEDAPSYLRHHFSFLAHLVGVQRGCVFWRWRLVPTRVGVSPGRAPARIEGFWVASGTRVASTSVVVTASSELGCDEILEVEFHSCVLPIDLF